MKKRWCVGNIVFENWKFQKRHFLLHRKCRFFSSHKVMVCTGHNTCPKKMTNPMNKSHDETCRGRCHLIAIWTNVIFWSVAFLSLLRNKEGVFGRFHTVRGLRVLLKLIGGPPWDKEFWITLFWFGVINAWLKSLFVSALFEDFTHGFIKTVLQYYTIVDFLLIFMWTQLWIALLWNGSLTNISELSWFKFLRQTRVWGL